MHQFTQDILKTERRNYISQQIFVLFEIEVFLSFSMYFNDSAERFNR